MFTCFRYGVKLLAYVRSLSMVKPWEITQIVRFLCGAAVKIVKSTDKLFVICVKQGKKYTL